MQKRSYKHAISATSLELIEMFLPNLHDMFIYYDYKTIKDTI